nr:ABC transporter ATP-binding protein [Lachnospiraceae bacterium]
AALDYETSIEVLKAFEEVVKTGTTLIMVTHNEEITRMAHRVVRFRNGKTYEVTINKNPVEAKELVW